MCLNPFPCLGFFLSRQVSTVSGTVTEAMVSSFQVVVMIDATLEEQLRVNDLCHSKGVCFISCDARGVFAYAFCDFGDAFVVSDVDGNQAASCVVSSVTKDAIGLVTVMDDQRHNLVTGDVVTFNSIQGMTEVWCVICYSSTCCAVLCCAK